MTKARTAFAAAVVVAALAETGCAGRRAQPPAATPSNTVAAAPDDSTARDQPDAAPASPTATALTEEDIFARKSLEQLNSESPLVDVFFEVDQSVIPADARRDWRATPGGFAAGARRASASRGTATPGELPNTTWRLANGGPRPSPTIWPTSAWRTRVSSRLPKARKRPSVSTKWNRAGVSTAAAIS